MKHIVTDHF